MLTEVSSKRSPQSSRGSQPQLQLPEHRHQRPIKTCSSVFITAELFGWQALPGFDRGRATLIRSCLVV